MELLLYDGDYRADRAGRLESASDTGEILQRAQFKISVRRGSFPLMPELGSRLYLLSREKPSARVSAARMYIAEALADEPDLSVGEIAIAEAEGAISLAVELKYMGESHRLSLSVQR